MTVTMEQVIAVLSPDEPNYDNASKLGPEALQHLEKLIKGENVELAAKATSLASLIQHENSVNVLITAAHSEHAVVRVAAAAGSKNLRISSVQKLLDILKNDKDVTIRNRARIISESQGNG